MTMMVDNTVWYEQCISPPKPKGKGVSSLIVLLYIVYTIYTEYKTYNITPYRVHTFSISIIHDFDQAYRNNWVNHLVNIKKNNNNILSPILGFSTLSSNNLYENHSSFGILFRGWAKDQHIFTSHFNSALMLEPQATSSLAYIAKSNISLLQFSLSQPILLDPCYRGFFHFCLKSQKILQHCLPPHALSWMQFSGQCHVGCLKNYTCTKKGSP